MLRPKAKRLTGMDESVKDLARPAACRSLREAIRKARVEEAERLDAAADHRDGEIARLELLKAELEAVFAEIPRMTTASIWCSCRAARRGCGSTSSPMPRSTKRRAPISSSATARAAAHAVQLDQCRRYRRSHHPLHGARDRAPGADRGGADRAGAWAEARRARGAGTARHGRRDCGVRHRHSHRRGRAVRRGVAHHALGSDLRTRRSHSQTWGHRRRRAPTISHLPAVATLPMRIRCSAPRDASLDRLRRRRHADDDRGSGHGRRARTRVCA